MRARRAPPVSSRWTPTETRSSSISTADVPALVGGRLPPGVPTPTPVVVHPAFPVAPVALRLYRISRTTMSNRIPLLLILATASCGGAPTVTPPSPLTATPPSVQAAALPPAPAAAPPPGIRLPRTVKPVRYSATPTIVPAEETTKGSIDIDLSFGEPSQTLWLNARELTVDAASLEAGGKKIEARALPGGDDFVGFALAEQAPAGPARLHVDYRGKISSK